MKVYFKILNKCFDVFFIDIRIFWLCDLIFISCVVFIIYIDIDVFFEVCI